MTTLKSVEATRVRLNCSRTHLYRLLSAGKIEAIKDGRRIKIIDDSVDAYLASLPRAKIKPDKRDAANAAA